MFQNFIHYSDAKQVVKYIKNRMKHLDVTDKHIFHNCINACMKKIHKSGNFKAKADDFFFFKQLRKHIDQIKKIKISFY